MYFYYRLTWDDKSCLDLDLLETVSPDGSVGGNTILAEVNQDVPRNSQFEISEVKSSCGDIHGITVHGLAHENIIVVPVGKDLLHSASGLGLPHLLSLCRIRGLSELGGGILVELLKVGYIKQQKSVICTDQADIKG